LVGHEDLVKDAGNKVDRLINDTGIRHLIKSSAARSRNVKSGDTDNRKDFAGGYLKMGVANHKALRNISMKFGFIDDFESMRSDSKQSGSTAELVEQRFASFGDSMKLFYISTPEKKEGSNIHGVYLKGDQRKYHIPCPCCNELIVIYWEVQSELHDQKKAGITWQLDEAGELIEDSVGYICQKCDEFFTDENKSQWLLEEGFGGRAKWLPTAKASEPGYGSVAKIITYFKRPNLRLKSFDNYYVPFIHKLHPNTVTGMPTYPFYVDPTRRINTDEVFLITDSMHHFSYCRLDIERKMRNSSARNNIMKSKLLEDYNNPNLGAGYFLKDYGQTLIEFEDIFGLSKIFE